MVEVSRLIDGVLPSLGGRARETVFHGDLVVEVEAVASCE
jgi:hypothetical protein